MTNQKEVLVITTPSPDGLKIKKYLKPISAHIVAGTNLFSDFLGSFSDVFGGRSHTYQKQLISLYEEAVSKIKLAAYEIGGNAVVGLSIDIDEISGKGKSMFMITAIGTAVVLEQPVRPQNDEIEDKFENIAVEKLNLLKKKREIVSQAETAKLTLNEEVWNFLITNRVKEVYSFLVSKIPHYKDSDVWHTFINNFTDYLNALSDIDKTELLYHSFQTDENNTVKNVLYNLAKDLNMFNAEQVMLLLEDKNFEVQKVGVKLSVIDQPYYAKEDVHKLNNIKTFIKENFPERGERSMKKQLLSGEKEVWKCECGKSNNSGHFCGTCLKDIYGFKESEVTPNEASRLIENKIDLITALSK